MWYVPELGDKGVGAEPRGDWKHYEGEFVVHVEIACMVIALPFGLQVCSRTEILWRGGWNIYNHSPKVSVILDECAGNGSGIKMGKCGISECGVYTFRCNTPAHLFRCYRVYRAVLCMKFCVARLCIVGHVVTKFQASTQSEQDVTTHQTYCFGCHAPL